MKQFFLPTLLIFFSLTANFAQRLQHAQGQLLIKPRTGVEVEQWVRQWAVFDGNKTNLSVVKRVSEPLNIWLVAFDYTRIHEFKFLEAIRRDKAIDVAQFNHLTELRSRLPNDPLINLQWQYLNVGQSGGAIGADFDLDLAWDITIGGVTPSGDTIVVCIIDDGLNRDHPDFAGNIWVNHREIPNNGIDDDGNGFVDDYRGWNTARDNDEVFDRSTHGTPVAGIIGARGNNGIGVSGVNWQVKLMIVRGGIGLESEAIEAYSYPLSLRRLYNRTNGQRGAFVVATNSSWGASYLFPSDAPLWCAMYDSLGVHGVLNAGATANLDINVDVAGDLPSTCPSDYLIAVTNLNDRNQLALPTAYGPQSVDLAAYGEGIWTVNAPTSYGAFNGTSAATPHVAGAIALLYSAPCPGFAALYKSDPKAAALLVRQFILEGVVPTAVLQSITVTQGRLNINNSMRRLMDACSACFPPTSLSASNITDTRAQLSWNANANIQRVDLRWRAVGANTWTEVINARSPFQLANLQVCTSYEFQLKGVCAGEELKYTSSFVFRTDGCCEPPTGLQVLAFLGNNIASFRWNSVLAAQRYTLRLRPVGTTEWRVINSFATSISANNLLPCTRYEAQVNTICNGEPSDFSAAYFFQTPGCGACRDLQYCRSFNLKAEEEWIALVRLGTLQNVSLSNNGYGDFTGREAPQLMQGNRYEIELRPGFSGVSYTEYFMVWIDFNQNGFFETSERVFERGGNLPVFRDSILIPMSAKPGVTRMRVAMQFLSPGGPCSFNNNSGGEVEDYCVQIMERTTSSGQTTTLTARIHLAPNPFSGQLWLELNLPQAQAQMQVCLFNAVGQQAYCQKLEQLPAGDSKIALPLAALPRGMYWLQCRLSDGSLITRKVVKGD